jgi:PEP-CTERM motif
MRTMTKLMLGLALPVAFLAAESAFAVKITQWDYENISAFTANTGTGVTGSNPNNATFTLGGAPAVGFGIPGSPTTLSWGVPASGIGQSSLSIDNAKNSGVVNTDGAAAHDLTLTHNNFVINNDGKTLRTATLTGDLLMQAKTPATGDVIGPLAGVFLINFKETPNSGICPTGVNPCPDIFAVDELNSTDLTAIIPLGAIQDYNYFLQLVIPSLQVLNDASCTAVGLGSGCRGFATLENQSNSLEVLFKITSQKIPTSVPEPGIIALLGLGLAGLGFAQKRSRK